MYKIVYKSHIKWFTEFTLVYELIKGQIPIIPRIGEKFAIPVKNTDEFLILLVQDVIYFRFDKGGRFLQDATVEIWLG